MQYTYSGIVSQMKSDLSLLSNWTKTLYYGVYERLIEVVAYVIDKFIYLAEFYYKESGWLTATRVESLINQAYFLQYYAHRKTGSIGYVKLSADSTFSSSYVYTGYNVPIPKWSVIQSTDGTQNVYVSTATTYYKNYIGPLSVAVSEGTPATFTYTASGIANESFTLYSDSIDTNNMEIWAVDSNDNPLYQINIIANLYLTPDLVSYYCQVSNVADFSSVKITFGDGIEALKLNAGDNIKVFYGITGGDESVIANTGVLTKISSTLYDTYGNEVTLYSTNSQAITGGTTVEDIESIRNNAPNIFQTGYRAGCEGDWKSIINGVSYIERGSAWTMSGLGGSTLTAGQQTVYVTAVNTAGTDLTDDQLADLSTNVLFPVKSMTEAVTYQLIEKLYIGASGSVELTDNITNADALGQIQAAMTTKFGVFNTTFMQSAYETKISATIDNLDCVVQHKTDFFNVQKDYMTPGGAILALTASQSNIALYPIYSGVIGTDSVQIVPNSVKIWVDDGVTVLPILVATEVGGVFYNAHPNYVVAGAINYTNGQNSCTYNISSGTVDTVYLSYKTQDGLGFQTESVRTPYGWQVTDVDDFMLIIDFNVF